MIEDDEAATFPFSTDQRVGAGPPQKISLDVYCHPDSGNMGAPTYKTIGESDPLDFGPFVPVLTLFVPPPPAEFLNPIGYRKSGKQTADLLVIRPNIDILSPHRRGKAWDCHCRYP